MKQDVSPKVVAVVVAVAVLLISGIGFWVWRAPSVTAAPGTQAKDAMGQPIQSPRAGGGGPTAEDLRKRDEYNAAHPDAAGSTSAGRRPF